MSLGFVPGGVSASFCLTLNLIPDDEEHSLCFPWKASVKSWDQFIRWKNLHPPLCCFIRKQPVYYTEAFQGKTIVSRILQVTNCCVCLQNCKVSGSLCDNTHAHQEQVGIHRLAQGNFGTWASTVRDRTARWAALPPEPQPLLQSWMNLIHLGTINKRELCSDQDSVQNWFWQEGQGKRDYLSSDTSVKSRLTSVIFIFYYCD